jgi:hypothetical protein
MMHRSRAWTAAVLCLAVAACGGSDVTSPDAGDDPGDPPVENPSFSLDVVPIFVAGGCTAGNCHGGGAGGLTLTSSSATSYANLVNVPSSSDDSFLRVEPGNPTDSYLVMKLEGRGGRQTMPLGRAPLSTNQIGTIRNWITADAPDN